jgi:hypothetical protein
MRRTNVGVLLLSAVLVCFDAGAEVLEATLRIWTDGNEATVTRENLIAIQQFIIGRGQRETYCNMYNDNPAFHTENYSFYLNPDTGQKNLFCDLEKSGFHHLTIRRPGGGRDQYRNVDFTSEHAIYVAAVRPADDLTVGGIRQFVVEAMEEILAVIAADLTAATP